MENRINREKDMGEKLNPLQMLAKIQATQEDYERKPVDIFKHEKKDEKIRWKEKIPQKEIEVDEDQEQLHEKVSKETTGSIYDLIVNNGKKLPIDVHRSNWKPDIHFVISEIKYGYALGIMYDKNFRIRKAQIKINEKTKYTYKRYVRVEVEKTDIDDLNKIAKIQKIQKCNRQEYKHVPDLLSEKHYYMPIIISALDWPENRYFIGEKIVNECLFGWLCMENGIKCRDSITLSNRNLFKIVKMDEINPY